MIAVSHDGGLRWSTATVVAGPSALEAISCSDAQTCVGLVGSGATNTYGTGSSVVTSDGGNTWTKVSAAVGAAVSCAIDDVCVSVGGRWHSATNAYPGDAFLSTDGGLHWTPMSIATPDSLNGVTCRSSTDCVAVGGNFPGGTSGAIITYGN